MIPLPGSPSSSWPVYKARMQAFVSSANARTCVAFWLFGLINNVLYVIILSAALDLVGPSVPKGVVLLADVIPSFFTKLLAPYFIHVIPYRLRILAFCALSAVGMLLIALTPPYADGGTISTKMAGVILASLSSGGGELSFLGLTHYYGPLSLAAWGSGTGAAGLVGAGAYAVATTALGMPVQTALLASSFLPAIMIISFFILLPQGPLRNVRSGVSSRIPAARHDSDLLDRDNHPEDDEEEEGLLNPGRKSTSHTQRESWQILLKSNLRRASKLFFPYMLPLLLVYIAEYTINQGVSPTLLFPISSSPFKHYRAFYPTYNAIYQVGVFISRSSTPFFRVHNLYFPSFLQVANLVLLTAHALFDFIPSVWIIFAVVFWEGLLGGLVYVNTFAEILDNVRDEDREFSLGATSVSDSGGICIAGFISMALEVWLCGWQVERGRPYCKEL